jgi:hypothetical protein
VAFETRQASVVCAGILVADILIPPLPALPAGGELLAADDFLVARADRRGDV